jgi:SAM-dependent methyltransferase
VLARAATSLRLRALDLGDRARGRADRLVPPRRLRGFTGDSDFLATGTELQRLLREHGGLEPGSRVLDVGCGIGRVARTLAGVLDPDAGGGYVGFDPVQEAIAWCAARYPGHFRFVHADLRNDLYHPEGAIVATEYRFPVDGGWATIAIATSVFTHLDADETGHYLAEVRRALAPGGVALLTFFLLDDGSRAAIEAGRVRQAFGGADAVAHDRAAVLGSIAAPTTVHEGRWRGGQGLSYQDLIVVRALG